MRRKTATSNPVQPTDLRRRPPPAISGLVRIGLASARRRAELPGTARRQAAPGGLASGRLHGEMYRRWGLATWG